MIGVAQAFKSAQQPHGMAQMASLSCLALTAGKLLPPSAILALSGAKLAYDLVVDRLNVNDFHKKANLNDYHQILQRERECTFSKDPNKVFHTRRRLKWLDDRRESFKATEDSLKTLAFSITAFVAAGVLNYYAS